LAAVTIGSIGMLALTLPVFTAASDETTQRSPSDKSKPAAHPPLDFSGHKRTGIASFYANWFAGRKMADGTPMNPRGRNAASRTLPLGTVAMVTNLETHKSAAVTIQDRGPYVRGRIIDLSPSTARRIGITRKKGIARVTVAPIEVPRPRAPTRVAVASTNAKRQNSAR
jgi:rare lipoprotein A